MTSPRRVVVIGGGIAGLATAALLARDGCEVTLLEQRSTLGGRAGSWARDGFRFDTGPSWYLMPEVFDHFFRLLGTSAKEQLDLVTLDPGYRVFSESGRTPLDVQADPAANRALFESVEKGAGAALDRYLDSARETYRLAVDRFLYSTYASLRPFMSKDVVARSARLIRLLTEPLDRFSARAVDDGVLRQILGYPAVFLGTSPDKAPSMYHLMSHLDLDDGVYYPQGGFSALIDAITALAQAEGVTILTGATATGIRTTRDGRRKRVTGVDFRNPTGSLQHIAADTVVSAVDREHTERDLLPADAVASRRRSVNPGPGAVLAMLGVRGRLPELTHHNLFFTTDWSANFERIYGKSPGIPDPASLYVCKPSESDASVAPPGTENLFVLIPVPADVTIGSGGDDGAGDPLVEQAVDSALDQISDWAKIPDLVDRIELRHTVGPKDFARDFNTLSGGALGPAHTLAQSAFFRSGNTSRRVRGLFYSGCTTIPGIGLPMCLISAELVVKRLRGDTSAGPLPEPLLPGSAVVLS